MIQVDQKTVTTCEEGYLIDPEAWEPAVARALAHTEGIELSELHWKVLQFMRDYFNEHQIAPDARFVIKHLAEDLGLGREARSELFRLFPYGYVQQACKIAGMRRPRAWSTG